MYNNVQYLPVYICHANFASHPEQFPAKLQIVDRIRMRKINFEHLTIPRPPSLSECEDIVSPLKLGSSGYTSVQAGKTGIVLRDLNPVA